MMDCLINFYKILYSSKINSEQNVKVSCKKLSETEKNCLLCVNVKKSIEHMKNNKSPGQDGFTAELYKIYIKDKDIKD